MADDPRTKGSKQLAPRRQRVQIDAIDAKILNALQRDNRITNQKLAEIAGTSPPTCLRRVQRLRAENVILSDVSLVDTSLLGDSVTVIVQVKLREEVHRSMAQTERRFRAIDEISQCFLITGEFDYVIVVTVRNMADYEQFIEQVLYADPSILRFTSSTVIRNVKNHVGVPIAVD